MAVPDKKSATSYGTAFLEGFVTVEVGSEYKPYQVHKALLVTHSEYFRKAFNGPWQEAEEKKVRLEDVDCGDFERFVKWLYTRIVPGENTDEDWNEDDCDENDDNAVTVWNCDYERAMIGACALGHRLQASAFRKPAELSCVDYFIRGRNHAYERTVVFAFANLPASESILRLLMDTHCAYFDKESKNHVEY